MKKTLSIFTASFNRAKLLERLYQSLCVQTIADFEWVIVDDGSTDNTETLVARFITDDRVKIIYHKQINKGKHYAINKGVSLASGKLFWIVDSDDFLPKNAVKTVFLEYNKIKSNPEIAGVAGRGMYNNGTIVGNSNFTEVVCNSLDIRYKYRVSGDLVEVFKTEILKKFPFPEIEGEKFCPEALIWNRIARNYNLLFFNKGIYIIEYMDGGLSSKIVQIRMKSPKASSIHYAELEKYDIPFLQKLKANINFWRFALCRSESIFTLHKNNPSVYSLFGLFLGFIFHQRDTIKNKNS